MLSPHQKPQILTGDGTYEEVWLAPHLWRREVTLGSYHAVEVESPAGRKMHASSDYEPSRILMLLTDILCPIPKELLTKESEEYRNGNWSVAPVSDGDLSLVAATSKVPASDRFTLHKGFYFLPKGLLVFSKSPGLTTSWQDYVAFAGKAVPGSISMQAQGIRPKDPDRNLLSAKLTIAPAGETDPAVFELPGPTAEPGNTLRPLYKFDRYPQLISNIEGMAQHHDAAFQLAGALDRKGEYREVEVLAVEDAESLHEILTQVRRLRFRPAEIDGSRCEMPFSINFMVENHMELH